MWHCLNRQAVQGPEVSELLLTLLSPWESRERERETERDREMLLKPSIDRPGENAGHEILIFPEISQFRCSPCR